VAQNLSAINSNPVEGRVRKYVARGWFNVRSVEEEPPYTLFQDNFCVKKFWWWVRVRKYNSSDIKSHFHAWETQDLRERTTQAEGVWKPRRLTEDSEPGLKVSLTKQVLADHGFSRRHIAIVFNPSATDWLELPREYFLFDVCKASGIELECNQMDYK
jgi:hypothetical protein